MAPKKVEIQTFYFKNDFLFMNLGPLKTSGRNPLTFYFGVGLPWAL